MQIGGGGDFQPSSPMVLLCVLLILLLVPSTNSVKGCAIAPDGAGHVDIPSTWTSIPDEAFHMCSTLTSVTIPNTTTEIGEKAFQSTGLNGTLVIPDSVVSLGIASFDKLEKLKTRLEIGNGIETIPQDAFREATNVESITLGKNVTVIGTQAFFKAKKVKEITFHDKIREIRFAAFGYLRLVSTYTFPRSLESIGKSAFLFNELLMSVTFNSEVLVMGEQPFLGCYTLKAENVLYNKNISISSNESQVNSKVEWGEVIAVQCTPDGGCVCEGGYGNGVKGSKAADYFSCKPCDAGSSSTDPLSQGECELCTEGTYAEEAKTQKCTKCIVGKYGNALGAWSESIACRNCTAGRYSSSAGQKTECDRCPPGNSCPDTGMEKYTLCPRGRYQDEWEQESCKKCERGKYQDREGQAVCVECEAGKYNFNETSTNGSACVDCAAGKYASQSGTSNCTKCDKDSFTDSSSMSVCTACDKGWTTTGVTVDGTGASYCVVEERPCVAGEMKNATGACEECRAGRYSSDGVKCEECGAGRYGNVTGAGSEEAGCTECAAGSYMDLKGAEKCEDCPPGSYCPSPGMDMSNPCPPGSFTDIPKQVNCTACPAGRYQDSDEGTAKCVLCPAGTANALSGSADATSCVACGAGRYAGQSGTAECMSCAVGQFQAESGQAQCHVCEEYFDDATLTSSADHTGCEFNAALAQSRLMEVMFRGGLAILFSFLVTLMFMSAAGLVTYMREKEPERLANYSRVEAAIYSAIPGFSFGADLFLIAYVWSESRGLGGTMVLARLLHVAGGIALIVCLFGPVERVRGASAYVDYFVRDAHVQREYLDGEFVRENVYIAEGVALLSFCDVTMLQYLPWKKSLTLTKRGVYPSRAFMRTCVMIKVTQVLVTVVCEACYLAAYSGGWDPATYAQAAALFYMNIVFSMAVIALYLRAMLASAGEASAQGKAAPKLSDGMEMSDVYAGGTSDTSGSGFEPQHREVGAASERSALEDSSLTFTANPMLAVATAAAAAANESVSSATQPAGVASDSGTVSVLREGEDAKARGGVAMGVGVPGAGGRQGGSAASAPPSVMSRHRLSIMIESMDSGGTGGD